MNFELLIAKRLIGSRGYKNNISAPIIKIAITAIAIGVIMMLVSVATGIGLKQKIREKIEAFNGHIIIGNLDNISADVTDHPIALPQDFYPDFKAVPEVSHIQAVASKYGVIRTETDFEAAVVKGVGPDYEWKYFKDFLVEGRLPDYGDSKEYSTEILLSQYMANRLGFKIGDKVIVYFMNSDKQNRTRLVAFDIVGIFNSGFREFDKTYLIADLTQIQRLNKWDKNEVGGFEVFVNDFDDIDKLGGEVYQHLDYHWIPERLSRNSLRFLDGFPYLILILLLLSGL